MVRRRRQHNVTSRRREILDIKRKLAFLRKLEGKLREASALLGSRSARTLLS
jgi:hypothetical protein